MRRLGGAMREKAAQSRHARLPRLRGVERQEPHGHRDDGERHDLGTKRRLVDARHLARIDDVRPCTIPSSDRA